jgi:hypothetical protein
MNFIDRLLPAPKKRRLQHARVLDLVRLRRQRRRQPFPHVRLTLAQSLQDVAALAFFLRNRARFERYTRRAISIRRSCARPRDPKYFDGRNQHNPSIKKWGDTYYLYYFGATYDEPYPAPDEEIRTSAMSVYGTASASV